MGGSRIFRWLFGGLLVAIGLVLAIGGAKLLMLGGSPYYVLAGLACLASGVLLILGSRFALPLYALFLIATILWSIYEAGFQFWQLLPRLAGPAVLGLAMGLLALRFFRTGTRTRQHWALPAASILALALLAAAYPASRPDLPTHRLADSSAPTDAGEDQEDAWSAWGRTLAGTRYSPADQITLANVGELKQAWSYQTGETAAKMPDVKNLFSFMATPLMVEDRLYICTPRGLVAALDADTGKELWKFDPKPELADAQMLNCRGVSYHQAEGKEGLCAKRILGTTIDGRFYAIDAALGTPCPGFGEDGFVSLAEGMGDVTPGAAYTTSPPVVIGDAAVFGAYVRDNFKTGEPSGVVRAYNVITGEKLWAWDAGRPEDAGPLSEGESYTRGSPNSWTVLSADPELGLIFVPMGNATPDHVGMHRTPQDERYASSLVALDAQTGKVRWYFQTTRHDLWDYDIPAQPVQFDLPVDGGTAPAVAAITKRGEIFILDRRNGKPLTKVEDRPAPRGNIPGETYAATQPYSTGFPSFNPPKLREADMWGATPIDQMLCRLTYRSHDYAGDFTPPSVRGAIQYPGIFGVLNWGSATVDEGRKVMVVNSSAVPQIVKLYPREAGPQGDGTGNAHIAGYLPQQGTPYGVTLNPMLSPLGLPCHAPPWGHLAAIDLESRELLWKRPLGTSEDIAPLGISVPGIFSIGGPITTRTGLIFIAATLDDHLRAFDIASGKEVWKGRLPAGGQATPMTYRSSKTGRQYVVIAAGGHGFLGTTPGDYVVAFALDDGA